MPAPTTNVEINTPPAQNNTVVTPVQVQPMPVQDNRYVERPYAPQYQAQYPPQYPPQSAEHQPDSNDDHRDAV